MALSLVADQIALQNDWHEIPAVPLPCIRDACIQLVVLEHFRIPKHFKTVRMSLRIIVSPCARGLRT